MPSEILLNCQNVTKSFGHRPLLDGLSLTLLERDHVGLVGPNGAGKSTLLKILAGRIDPDSGTCGARKNMQVGYVPQNPNFPPDVTVAEIVTGSIRGGERVDAHHREQRVAMALSKTGFADPAVDTKTLSGGWRTRLAIACALALEPDLLLLDEPTNHLDLEAIWWLESWLANETKAFVVVSHDRYFLENVAGRMLDLDPVYPSGLLAVRGSYADLLEARDQLLSSLASYEASLRNRLRREVAWLRRGAKARTSKSRARIQAAERSMDELEEMRSRSATRTAGIELASTGRKTKRLWLCEGLGKRFGETRIVDELDLLLVPGMRLAVHGPNGSGKTTVLRMMVGEIEPSAGRIERADELRIVYFDQTRSSLDPTLSLKRALAPEGDNVFYRGRSLHVSGWARRFLFRPEQLDTPVSRLSGGERARVVLAGVMRQPADLLILDEPTNDLDIPTLAVLEESLLEFQGALVFVTHDRHLIDRVATEILALDGRGATQRYADYDQWEAERRRVGGARKVKPRQAEKLTKRPQTRRLSYLEQREFDGMADKVLSAEQELDETRLLAEDPTIASDAMALQERWAKLEQAQKEVDRLYTRWAELEEKSTGSD